MPTLHQTFTPVTIHTAKCDICNQHNRSVLFRCADCGWHVCTPCWTEKGGDGTHVMNEGADRGWKRAGVDVGVGRGRGRGAGAGAGGGGGAGGSGVRRRRKTDIGVEGEEGARARARIQNPRQRRDGDAAPTPISVAAAADLLIQAASRATPSPRPSPSRSPRPSFSLRRPGPTASTRPLGRADARPTATTTTRPSTSVVPTMTTGPPATGPLPSTATSVSASASASASRRENANISRLLRAAETIDRSSTPPLAPAALPVRESTGWSRRGRGRGRERRAASPLFVEYGLVEVEEEVLVEDSVSDDDDDDGDGDDEMTGMGREMEMTPEPRSADEDMCDEMRDDVPGRVLEMSDDGREVVGGQSRVPELVAGEREVVMTNGGRDEGVMGRRKGKGKEDVGAKVPVARRLRELYRSAVMVKDRKGRMRRVGGGLVGREEGL